MINYHKTLVSALETVLPTYYELFLSRDCEVPCISYMELNNSDDRTGDTLGYSRIQYQVKVWGNRLEDLQKYALTIDKTLRALGFKRISSGELFDRESTMIQKILTYEALGREEYSNN